MFGLLPFLLLRFISYLLLIMKFKRPTFSQYSSSWCKNFSDTFLDPWVDIKSLTCCDLGDSDNLEEA